MADREFIYNRETNRYRYKDSGRFAPKSAIINLTKKNIKNTEKELETITGLLFDGNMRLDDWQRTSAKTIKTLHLEHLLLGKGGVNNTNDSDYLAIGRDLRKEYGYLRQFAQDIKDGKVSRKQALTRVKMYGNKSRHAYWVGNDRANNKGWMKRNLGLTDIYCEDCLRYFSLGWQPRGTLPMPTEACQCRANCKCSVIYSKELPTEDSITDALTRFSRGFGFIGST